MRSVLGHGKALRRVFAGVLGAAAVSLTMPADAQAQDRTRYGLGAEFGYQSMFGANGAALDGAPMVRVMGEVHPSDPYVVQLIYGYSSHTLSNPAALAEFSQPDDLFGSMDMHLLNVGFKGYPELAEGAFQFVRPFMVSGMGLVHSAGRVGSETVPQVYTRNKGWLFDMEFGAGAELTLDVVSLGAVARIGFIPAFSGSITDELKLMVVWPYSFAVTGSIAI